MKAKNDKLVFSLLVRSIMICNNDIVICYDYFPLLFVEMLNL